VGDKVTKRYKKKITHILGKKEGNWRVCEGVKFLEIVGIWEFEKKEMPLPQQP